MKFLNGLFSDRKRKIWVVILLFTLVPAGYVLAQTDSVAAAGSTKFKEGGGRNTWMGRNYRKEWKQEVKAPVLNLSTEKGGLTPTKRGGGKQTKTLRLEDAQGHQYSLRSIEKFITVKTLPIALESELAVDLVADGVSASYPYANLSVPILAKAAGIPHSQSKLVWIPDDPKLGEYKADFANMLAFFETRLPDSVKKDYNTDEVAEKLKDDNDNEVDQYAMLKARILDMFVMDLDRHEDQWEWGAYEKDKGKVYYPVGRDKDQAFYINEGFLPWTASWAWLVPQLEGFKAKARNINRFNWAARNLDRFFLNELSEADWKKAVDEFLAAMTDDVIKAAFDAQPEAVKQYRWNEIMGILKNRRQNLASEVMEYYRFLSEDVNVTASDKKELFDITLNDDGSVLLQVFKITNEGNQSTKIYDRLFDAAVTKELRLYGFGGDDKFMLKGKEDKIKIRMIGGEGKDEFVNSTNTGETGIVYDLESENNVVTGDLKDRMRNDTMANYYNRLDYRYNNAFPFFSIEYNKDDGLSLGVALTLVRHGFRKDPYKNLHKFAINHALATKAYHFRYYAEFISTFGRFSDLLLDFDLKAPNNTTNFFGYGVNSVYDKSSPGEFEFYRARYNLGDFSVLWRKRFSHKVVLTLGPTFQYYHLDSTENKGKAILNTGDNGLNPATLFNRQSYLGALMTFLVDTRDNPIIPQKGIHWLTTVRHLSGMNDNSYDVTQLNSAFTFNLSIIKKWVMLSNRFGGGHNFGDFEFYQAQYLGNEDNLRGYRKYRFAGESKIFNNTELRIALAKFKTYLFGGAIGLLGFYDTGKVFHEVDDDTTSKWLSGYGGGIWIAPFRRFVFTFMYAASKEDKLPLINLGWQF